MSNVLNFSVFKNTLKRTGGYAPVSGEHGYSIIRCEFAENGDWENAGTVTAGFFVSAKNTVGVEAHVNSHVALIEIPGTLIQNYPQVCFGLSYSFTQNGKTVTIATNLVAIDIERGIVAENLSENEDVVSRYEELMAELNAALALKANTADVNAKNDAQDAAIAAKADTADVNAALALKANTADVNAKNDAQDAAIAAKADTADVNAALALKADTADVNAKNDAQDAAIAAKADAADVYNKTEADEKYLEKSKASLYEKKAFKLNSIDLNFPCLSGAYPEAEAVRLLVKQAVSGKEDSYNKEAAINNDNKTSTTKYPTIKAVVDYINSLPIGKGEKGDKGDRGFSIVGVSIENGNLYVQLEVEGDEVQIINVGRVRGSDGSPGANGTNGDGYSGANIDESGDLIVTEILGNGTQRTVNLGHVVGAKGAKGDKGDKGETGAAGADWVPTAAEKTAIATEAAGMVNVPTKTSQLMNDSGFLTAHQDISGKEDKNNKVNNISPDSFGYIKDGTIYYPDENGEIHVPQDDGSILVITIDKYPSAQAVWKYVAEKTYTKAQVDSAIQTAIGGVENGSY